VESSNYQFWTLAGDVARNLNLLSEATMNYEMALKLLDQSAALPPEEKSRIGCDILVNLGSAYHEMNDFDKSRKAHERASKLNPGSPYPHLNLAEIASQTGVDETKRRLSVRSHLEAGIPLIYPGDFYLIMQVVLNSLFSPDGELYIEMLRSHDKLDSRMYHIIRQKREEIQANEVVSNELKRVGSAQVTLYSINGGIQGAVGNNAGGTVSS
jgi:tetratricopeptide (TPR) repeat protein